MIYIQGRRVSVDKDGNQVRTTWDTLKGYTKEEFDEMMKRYGLPPWLRGMYGDEYRIINTEEVQGD
jgi:hypothetical protein